jgi:hypothetical protein
MLMHGLANFKLYISVVTSEPEGVLSPRNINSTAVVEGPLNVEDPLTI